MLLKVFKGNYLYNFILLPIIAGLLLLATFLKGFNSGITYNLQESVLLNIIFPQGISFIASTIINYFILILLSFFLLHINALFSFVKERTFLPSYLYLFIVLALPELHILGPTSIAALFIILAIHRLFNALDKKTPISNTFDAGFLIGTAGLFSFNTSIFILLVPVSVFILNRNLTWRCIAIPITGILLPWIFLFALLFIFSDVNVAIGSINNALQLKEEVLLENLSMQVYFAYLLFITIIASLFLLKEYGIKSISNRKYFKILFYFFITSVFLLISPYATSKIIAILAIPLTFLLTNYFLMMKRRKWAEILFTTLVIISLFIQYFV